LSIKTYQKYQGMTKRGKELKMTLSPNYNIVCGTVDNKNAKAIYVNISAWGEPTSEDEMDYGRIISRLNKCVRQSTFNHLKSNHPNTFYPERTIVDLDMRESGVKFGKRSFMNCEMTIFQKHLNDNGSINEGPTPEKLENIVKEAISCLDSFDHFSFNQKKN
jgi:hypothetical protein